MEKYYLIKILDMEINKEQIEAEIYMQSQIYQDSWGQKRVIDSADFSKLADKILRLLQPNGPNPIVSGSLPPVTKADICEVAKEIVASLKNAFGMQPNKFSEIDWEMLQGDWFDTLEEKFGGNDR